MIDTRLVAHRGASAVRPENTISALKQAHALGASWVEFDVMLSQDRCPVIFHDLVLGRTTNATGPVNQQTCAQLQALDAGSWFDTQFQDETISTLEQWLDEVLALGLSINLELKPAPGDAVALAYAVNSVLERSAYRSIRMLISSASTKCLSAFYCLNPRVNLAYICDYWPFAYWHILLKRFPTLYSLHIEYHALNPARVAKAHAKGLRVLAYTIESAACAQSLLAMGVDALFVNDIAAMKEICEP